MVLSDVPVIVNPVGYKPSGGDDTAGIQACIDSGSCSLQPNATYSAMNLVVGEGETLDCQGSIINSRSSVALNPVIKVTGRASKLINCQPFDWGANTMRTTTLSSGAAGGSATVSVASASGFAVGVGQLISVRLASGAHWVTEISNVSGTTITLWDAVPYNATAVAISSGGTTCQVGDVLIVQGGITAYGGGPTTIRVDSVSGGVVTGASILVPGFYSTAPNNPVSTTSRVSGHCTSLPTFNVTFSGASNGATVETAIGTVLVDATHYGTISGISTVGPIGIQIINTNGPTASGTANFSIRDIRTDSLMASVFVGPGVSNITIDTVGSYGTNSLVSPAPGGYRGFYWSTRGGVPDTGAAANRFTNMLYQGYEIGGVMHTPFAGMFDNITFDTCGYYGASIDNAGVNSFSNMAFYGTSLGYYSGPNFQGIGLVVANSFTINNLGVNLGFQYNAAAMWIADTNTTFQIPWNTFGRQTEVEGPGASIFLAALTMPVSYGGTGTSLQFPTGSVVFAGASGVYGFDNTKFVWDNNNKRLGIGTSTPTSELDMGTGTITVPTLIRGSLTGNTAGSLNLTGGNAFNGGTGAAIVLRGLTNGFNNGGMEFYYGSGGVTNQGMRLASTGLTVAVPIVAQSLPTSCVGQATGTLWNNLNIVNVCP